MTTSPQKRQANRANALRSTGPRSAIGKRIAAQNARAHGLSVALDPVAIEPQVQKISELLLEEGISTTQAHEIAIRILDYERNLQHERKTFAEKFLGESGEGALSDEAQSLALYDEYLSLPEFASERGLDAQERLEQRAFRAVARFMQRSLRKQAKDDALSAVRHHKRSSNQLIKALKVL
jgi:hypothetical protein